MVNKKGTGRNGLGLGINPVHTVIKSSEIVVKKCLPVYE